jgi:hypothetical protein
MSTDNKFRYQRWEWISGLALVSTILCSYFSVKSLWPYGPKWWTFAELGEIYKAIYLEFLFFKTDLFELFVSEIISNEWFFQFLLFGILPIILSGIISFYIVIKILYKEGGIDNCVHMDGPMLYFGKYGLRHGKKMLAKQLRQNDSIGLNVHPSVSIPKSLEQSNIIAFGSQGSGKSVVLKPIANQLIEKADKSFFYDSKREYTQLFFGPNTVLLNPTDSRSHAWAICEDVTTAEAAQLVANCFLHEESGDKFWVQGARIILTGCLVTLLKSKASWNWDDLKTILNCEVKQLKEFFKTYYPEANNLIEEDSKTTQGFLAVISTQLTWLSYVASVWSEKSENRFSVSSWLKDTSTVSTVIVPSNPAYPQISGPLCAALMSIIVSQKLSKPDTDYTTWLILDELADLPKTDMFEKWLSLGRSKGARTIAGLQNFNQLADIYGDKKAETILSLFGILICLRTNSFSSSKLLSENLGSRRVKRWTESYNSDGSKSSSLQIHEEPIVRPEDINQLPAPSKKGVTGYLSIKGWNSAYKLVWGYPKIEERYESFVEQVANLGDIADSKNQRRGTRGRARP